MTVGLILAGAALALILPLMGLCVWNIAIAVRRRMQGVE